MSRHFISILFCGLLACCVTLFYGCEKDEADYGSLVVFSAEEIGLETFKNYTICSDVNGNIYAVQETDDEDVFNLFYLQKGNDDWSTIAFSFVAQDPYYVTDKNNMKTTTDGSVWLLGHEEIVRFKGGGILQTYPIDHLIVTGSELGVSRFATFGNEVWLLHWNYGLFQLDITTGETVGYQDPGYSGTDMLLAIDNDGNKWITKNNYDHNVIALMADGSWQTASDPDSLIGCPECVMWGGTTHESFRGIETDAIGNTYLQSDIGKLFRLSNGVIQSMAINYMSYTDGFIMDRNDNLWFYRTHSIVTMPKSSILYRYNGGTAEQVIDLTAAFSGNVWPYNLTFDHNNNAWVASNKGIAVYNENGVEF